MQGQLPVQLPALSAGMTIPLHFQLPAVTKLYQLLRQITMYQYMQALSDVTMTNVHQILLKINP